MTLLAVKIGNTNIGFGVMDGAQLIRSWRIETRDRTADEYASQLLDFLSVAGDAPIRIDAVAMVSVVPTLTATFQEVARKQLGHDPFIAQTGVKSGIRIRYQDPRALGADRLVAMVAAKSRYGVPALVADFGTATTFNALDADGDFVGGAIAPGLDLEAEALHRFTAKLPRVDIAPPPHALATSTADALRSGIFFGYVGLVEGLVARLLAEMRAPQAQVIATGGLASLVAPHCPSIKQVDPELTFEGLRILYEMNIDRKDK